MNIVTATFSAGCTQIDADRKLWQYDQGQILQLVGLDLPDAYQVEFSNSRDKGSAKAQIGGPDGVSIPDEYLTTGKPVYAFLVGHTAEEDRETEKLVVIYVNARSQPTDEPITPEQQTIVDQLIAALTAGVAKAEDAAAQAEAAISYMPKIVDGTWWVYDAEAETWTDTGIQAEGQDGVGISGAVLNADFTLTLTFTDGTNYTTPPIRGAQGERGPIGPTPDISIGTVTTGAAGSQAEATMTGTPERPVLNLTIPRGDPGEVTQAEFDELADEVAQQKSAFEDLQDLTNRKAGALIDTASGAIASFTPDATVPNLLNVSVNIEPVQAGSGDPSPDNVRPISGWDSVDIMRSGADTTNPTTYTIQLGDTVYGGTLTIAEDGSVNALVDRAVYTITGGETFISFEAGTNTSRCYLSSVRFSPTIRPNNSNICEISCDTLPAFAPDYIYRKDTQGISENKNDISNGLWIRINNNLLDEPTLAGMKAFFAQHPITVCYYLATPITIDLDPVTIATISGQTNNVWADAGDVTVEFAADLKHYIDSKIAAAVAAMS